jgi:electron transfer flavoprotein beta subunit
MHIVVCVKQVPDSAQIRVHPVTNRIMRQGVPAIINPFDLFALEEALRIKDRTGARVTVISMGPPAAEAALKKCVSFGADEAILLTDMAFAGADTLATTFVLMSAIRQIAKAHPVDIVFTGKQTIDGDTAQVGPGIAIRLGWELLTYVSKIRSIDTDTQQIVIERRAEGGVQVLESRLPCVITLLEGINEMRFADMDGMFRAARYDVPHWGVAGAGIEDTSQAGMKGSPTAVAQVFAPKPKEVKALVIAGDTPQAKADALLDRMFADLPKLEKSLLDHLDAQGARQ